MGKFWGGDHFGIFLESTVLWFSVWTKGIKLQLLIRMRSTIKSFPIEVSKTFLKTGKLTVRDRGSLNYANMSNNAYMIYMLILPTEKFGLVSYFIISDISLTEKAWFQWRNSSPLPSQRFNMESENGTVISFGTTIFRNSIFNLGSVTPGFPAPALCRDLCETWKQRILRNHGNVSGTHGTMALSKWIHGLVEDLDKERHSTAGCLL